MSNLRAIRTDFFSINDLQKSPLIRCHGL